MLVYGCCRLVKEPCFLILICPLKSIFYCVRTDVLQMKNRSQIYKFYSTLYPQMMHIDKEQQNTSQATTATRSIENPVYTVSEELLVLYFQMTLKWYLRESSKKRLFYSQAGRKGLLRNQLVRYFCGKVNGRMTNEIKCVLSIKESNFDGKNGPNFLSLLTVRAKRPELWNNLVNILGGSSKDSNQWKRPNTKSFSNASDPPEDLASRR